LDGGEACLVALRPDGLEAARPAARGTAVFAGHSPANIALRHQRWLHRRIGRPSREATAQTADNSPGNGRNLHAPHQQPSSCRPRVARGVFFTRSVVTAVTHGREKQRPAPVLPPGARL